MRRLTSPLSIIYNLLTMTTLKREIELIEEDETLSLKERNRRIREVEQEEYCEPLYSPTH